jgi:hypothetical protein
MQNRENIMGAEVEKKRLLSELKIKASSNQELDIKSIQSVFLKARNAYQSEIKAPFKKSKLGISFGFLSWFRHENTPEEMKKIENALNSNKDSKEIENQLVKILTDCGSLWDRESNNHLFTNYFLLYLRKENIDAYRQIVGAAYGINFVSGAIELHRIDSRSPEIIFKQGFELKTTDNQPETRKCGYASFFNDSYGVSFSKKYSSFIQGHYYKIVLPENHHFLLIDIRNSPRNKNYLEQYEYAKELEEVNSLDSIPPKYIKSCRLFGQSKEFVNKTFTLLDSTTEYMSPRGCY